MIVYRPKDRYDILKLFYCFADFLISQINDDKIEVGKVWAGTTRHRGFDIVLINGKDLSKQMYVILEYDRMRGWSSVTPIEGFEFTLCQGGLEKATLISQDSNEYDKMLELFKAGLAYLQRHNTEHYGRIVKAVDLQSLERRSWKKSMRSIEHELSENIDMRMATESLKRKREQALADLVCKYRGQGYEILGEEN